MKAFDSAETVARRKLELLNAARGLAYRVAVPGNRVESLEGDRKGQHSIRINNQYRICFVVDGEDFYDVEITDYH
ncbi:MAG TPA: type II toxin-antitoxin system RelE/ParE family toxin [Chroococcales cyanobacterium]